MTPDYGIDPALFAADAIDDSTHEMIDAVERALAAVPRFDTVPPHVTREQRAAGEGPFPVSVLDPQAEVRRVAVAGREVPLRIFLPDEISGVYLHIHGGGWTFGAASEFDVRHREIAERCGLAVVSVDYRLAPEDPYPAGPDDCEAAALWLVENAKAEFGSERFLIGGESAGAHLSVVTLVRMRDLHGFSGFSRANLVFGAYDLQMTPSVKNWGSRQLILNTELVQWFVRQFTPSGDLADPDISPLYADLSGLPHALFSIGTLDPLLDDSLFMHSRWLAAGNRAELAIYPGGIHGFILFPFPLAREANDRIDAFLLEGATTTGE